MSTLFSYTVFSKSGMVDACPQYKGRSYGVLIIICKYRKVFILHFHELDISNDKIMAVGICDDHDQMAQMIANGFMAYYSRADHSPTFMYLDAIESLWAFLHNLLMLCPIKCFGDFSARLATSNVLPKSYTIV